MTIVRQAEMGPINQPARPEGFVFGQHLIMNLAGCPLYILQSEPPLADFVARLVMRIGMNAYGPTQIDYFGQASPATAGYTVVQKIETSLISGHMVDATRSAYWDVFSCKPFDVVTCLETAVEFFAPETLEWKVLYR
jgi:S-adenosylmethionine/arginine decarboxylase-like enzyme